MISASGFILHHIAPPLFDPLFAGLFRSDAFLANTDTSKFSIKKIDDSYMTFSQGISKVFPGYKVDKKLLICNEEDTSVDLDDLRGLLISKDLDYYEKVKD